MIHTPTPARTNYTPINELLVASGTALLTPDSASVTLNPWSPSLNADESEYSLALFANTPWCARGDDLDDDEAYFLDDEEEDDDDDYDEEDDDDDDDDEVDDNSSEEDDDEVL